jgi:hypothetical protein
MSVAAERATVAVFGADQDATGAETMEQMKMAETTPIRRVGRRLG